MTKYIQREQVENRWKSNLNLQILLKEDVIKLIAEFQQNQCDEAQERIG